MTLSERPYAQILVIVHVVVYVAAVVVFALLKATAIPFFVRASWAEVVYNPAITVISSILMCLSVDVIGYYFRSRRR